MPRARAERQKYENTLRAMTDVPPDLCPNCGKPLAVCICDRVEPVATNLRVVVLQHPQEDDQTLGTAKLIALTLPNSEIRVGLSWASLDHALGTKNASKDRWAVLAAAKLSAELPEAVKAQPVILVDRYGRPQDLKKHGLDGVIVLDGTWSQAKTLWWRNAWLLKLPRIVLTPREPSMYGRLRKEPRRDYVSTLEAIADILPALGESENARGSLRRLLRTLLQRVRDAKAVVAALPAGARADGDSGSRPGIAEASLEKAEAPTEKAE